MGNRTAWLRLLGACLIFRLQLAVCPLIQAQESAFVVSQQKMAQLPGHVSNVSMVDGDLYCFASGVLLKAHRSGEQLIGFWADTAFVKFDEDVEYVVRHPQSGDLYFTKRDTKGRSYLFRVVDDGKSSKTSMVRLGGGFLNKGMTVEHPTFSVDGKIMIFSSLEKTRSNGGYDLWYSLFDGKRWGKPENMGRRINTPADERAPVIYRDCLLFATNGYKEDNGHMSLYSTRLLSDRVVGDTVGMLQIGRCRVQRLPSPFNEDNSDDHDLAIDTSQGFSYWVSTRPSGDTDSQLYSFSGALDGILLWGLVTDCYDHPLPGVQVTARQGNDVVCNTFTDHEGFYRIYLQCNQYYDLSYQLDQYFTSFESINTTKDSDEYLIAETRQNVRLDRLPIGERIVYEDLFGPNVDTELSERGMEMLSPMVRFLNDNPTSSLQLTLMNDLTTDRIFNRLLTEQRIQSLEAHLLPQLPPTVKISIANGCDGTENCSSASGKSRLTVLINSDL